jgi:hypothetical protein
LCRERINDANLRRAAKNPIKINCFTRGSLERRNHFQFPQECLYVLGLLSLNRTDDNIFPAF